MSIRPATLVDMPQMLLNARKFIDTTVYKDIPYNQDSMRDAFLQMLEDGLLLVAEENGVHLGGVGAVRGPLYLNDRISIAQERFWWVEPSERSAGIGKGLLIAIEKAAKDAGCAYLCMIALANTGVEKVYEKFGYSLSEMNYLKAL